ncbi:hypothetical protein FJTKL_14945 [Diaporthe vaccinii]|uniref:Glycosyl hydrolase family 95 N-terminal domain-containing protein n=1 Tax=Diaporthe vaccinii TaxID=105482 RepID=A0ABR4E716_9PEZI
MTPSIVLASLLMSGASAAASTFDGSRFLWFNQPARQHFFEDAMPIGNGRIGATVYAGGSEVVGINENSIWTGPFQDRIAEDPQTALAVAREMLLAGNLSEARQYSMADLILNTLSPKAFSYFGNINIGFGHENSGLTDYVRWLDTKEGTTGVSYTYGGVNYFREYVASVPDGVLAASFNAGTGGALNLKISMSRKGSITTTAAAKDGKYTVTLVGSSSQAPDDDPIRWTGQARFALVGGSATVTNSTLVISNSTALQMFFDAETNYRFAE